MKNSNILYELYAIFTIFIYPLLLLFRLFKCFLSLLKAKNKTLTINDYFLATSVALFRVSKNAGVFKPSATWIELPWFQTPGLNENQRIEVFNILSLKEVLFSYTEAMFMFYYILYRDGMRLVFTSLYVFEWYLYYITITKIPNGSNIYFCNHKDGWSSLLGSIDNCTINLIQHGTEFLLSNKTNNKYLKYDREYDFWTGDYPIKYGNLNFVYVFSERDIRALKKSIIKITPQFIIVGYGITLEEMKPITHKKKVLIIGYYHAYSFYEEILLQYFQNKDVIVYLKNHPTVSPRIYNDLRKNYDFYFINEPVFPKVDLVLSYESTLALAYQDMKTRVVYYDSLDFTSLETLSIDV